MRLPKGKQFEEFLYSQPRGAVAQLGERLPCTQEARSSILLGSTIIKYPKVQGMVPYSFEIARFYLCQ